MAGGIELSGVGVELIPESGSGTVISVGLALPSSILTVTNSPVTSTGTLTGTLATQTANTVFAGPSSGSAATPTFRALATADLPAGSVTSQAATPVTLAGTDANKIYTNEGASSLIVFNLPTAAKGIGPYTFIVQDTDGIQIVASAGDTIRLGVNVSATAGNAQSTIIGSVVSIVAINATEWVATTVVGTWVVT